MKTLCRILDVAYYALIISLALFVGFELGRMGAWLWFRYENNQWMEVLAIGFGATVLGLIIGTFIIKWIETPPKNN